MKILKQFFLLLSLVVFGMAVLSCTTEEEEETKDNMEGSVNFDHPVYIGVNEVITMTLEGITYPTNPSYKWFFVSVVEDTLRTNTVTVQFPDSIATYGIYVFAESNGFYQSSNYLTMTTVDTVGGASFPGLKYSDKYIIDERDGQKYQYVTIGNLDWFAQNLAYAGAGVPYENSPVLHSVFGRYYYWEEATGGVSGTGLGGGPQGVCPEGWSVPTNDDWLDMGKALSGNEDLAFYDDWKGLASITSADAYMNEERFWEYNPDNEHTNTTGWNALSTGYTQLDHSIWSGYQSYGFWWSSTAKDDDKAYYRYQSKDLSTFPMNFTYKKGLGATVRCVRLAR